MFKATDSFRSAVMPKRAALPRMAYVEVKGASRRTWQAFASYLVIVNQPIANNEGGHEEQVNFATDTPFEHRINWLASCADERSRVVHVVAVQGRLACSTHVGLFLLHVQADRKEKSSEWQRSEVVH